MRNNLAQPLRKIALSFRTGRMGLWLESIFLVLILLMMAFSYHIISTYLDSDKLLPMGLTVTLLIANLLPAMIFLALMGRHIAFMRSAARPGRGQLHVRFVGLFSLITSIPMLMVVIFASLLFQYGLDFWFSERSRSMLDNANELARGYYEESKRDVSAETVAMASDLRQYLQQTKIDSPEFAEAYVFQILSRKLNEFAIVEMGEDGVIRTAAIVDPDNRTSSDRVTPDIIAFLDRGEDVVISSQADRIEVVTTLDRNSKIYLYAARESNQTALSQWQRAQSVVSDYDLLFARSQILQIQFNIALYILALLLLTLALWAALKFADHMVRPLTDVANAARKISKGDFSARVSGSRKSDELGMVGRAFNRMAARLSEQTNTLINVNNQLDERRAFIETVVESVTAGIISTSQNGRILLVNSMAISLLQYEGENIVGKSLHILSPQFDQLVADDADNVIIQYRRQEDILTLAVRITKQSFGHVITFEDITRQLQDQRQAAWSDVARRIAHEIKNPLTPIQLAAERLKRRYQKQFGTDDEIFSNLTGTIIRQVGDLRNIVDEFSSFARLPKPVFREENIFDLIRQSVFLQQVAHQNITFEVTGSHSDNEIYCDRRQMAQVFTNLIKNAIEAIEELQKSDESHEGRIIVSVATENHLVKLSIIDNGIGLPDEHSRIFEPYMTTREKGTGLGLAIVKKIIQEHFGTIKFSDNDKQGTRVTIILDQNILNHNIYERSNGQGDSASSHSAPQKKNKEKE